MVEITTDVARYLELAGLADILANEGKSLSEGDSKQLLEYKVIFSHKIYFGERQNYLQLIEDYLNKKFDTEDFDYFFYKFGAKIGIKSNRLNKIFDVTQSLLSQWIHERKNFLS